MTKYPEKGVFCVYLAAHQIIVAWMPYDSSSYFAFSQAEVNSTRWKSIA